MSLLMLVVVLAVGAVGLLSTLLLALALCVMGARNEQGSRTCERRGHGGR